MKEIELSILEKEIEPEQELHGKIKINYNGRYDSLVINARIERSSDVFHYISANGKRINYPYNRLSILKSDIGQSREVEFICKTSHIPQEKSNAKFRVTIIQEHKEIANDLKEIIIKM